MTTSWSVRARGSRASRPQSRLPPQETRSPSATARTTRAPARPAPPRSRSTRRSPSRVRARTRSSSVLPVTSRRRRRTCATRAGNIITVTAGRTNISGVTIFGANRHVEAGVDLHQRQRRRLQRRDRRHRSLRSVHRRQWCRLRRPRATRRTASATSSSSDSIIDGYDSAGVDPDATLANGTSRANSPSALYGLVDRQPHHRCRRRWPASPVRTAARHRTARSPSRSRTTSPTTPMPASTSSTRRTRARQRFNRNNVQRNRIGMRHEATSRSAGDDRPARSAEPLPPRRARELVGLPDGPVDGRRDRPRRRRQR